jgi:hypothetical protein
MFGFLDQPCKVGVAYRDSQAGIALITRRELAGFFVPLLGSLPIYHGIPTIRHQFS